MTGLFPVYLCSTSLKKKGYVSIVLLQAEKIYRYAYILVTGKCTEVAVDFLVLRSTTDVYV